MKKSLLLCYTLFLCSYFLVSQTNFNVKKELERTVKIPNSPEATAFKKYGDYSVGLYTGNPNISIPIYTYKGKEMNLPITLTYDASGIKVSQLASSAGLGWNLSVGGRVSRTVNGLVDDYTYISNNPYHSINNNSSIFLNGRNQGNLNHLITQFLNPPSKFDSFNKAIDYFDFLKEVSENRIDTQPDYFSFNALGYNNTFVFDFSDSEWKLKPLDNPRDKVEIYYSGGSISEFRVTTEDGVKLFFSLAEKTHTETVDNISSNNAIIQEYNSSWLLTKIISQNGKDTYDFFYSDLGLSTTEPQYIGNTVTNIMNGTPQEVVNSGQIIYNETSYKNSQQILTQVNHNALPIVKINYKSRADFNLNSAIDYIDILKHSTHNKLKKIKFNHSYFGNSSHPNSFFKRLKLDNIQEVFGINNNVLKTYSFDYFSPSNVPSRGSYAKDYLGLYNGINNSVLYPLYNAGTFVLSGADRAPRFNKAIIGTLKKITYPTGGYTIFDYEPNTSNVNFAHQSSTSSSNTHVYGSLSINGGIGNNTSCGVCCIDQYGNIPNINTTRFNISESGTYDINFSSIGSNGEAYLIQLSSIVKTHFPAAYQYNEIIDQSNCNELIPIKWSNFIGHDGDRVFLEHGAYQITLVKGYSPAQNNSSNLNVSREEILGNSSSNYLVAGFRIKNIKSFDNNNASLPSLEKQFKYTLSFNSNVTSGVMLQKPTFYKTSNFVIKNGGTAFPVIKLTRPSSIYGGGSAPHIGYSKVFEIQKDRLNNKGYIEHVFNTGKESGINNNGFVNFYNKDFLNGKSKKVITYNVSGVSLTKETTEYVNSTFNGKSTLYIYYQPENSYKYIRIYKDYSDGGKFKFSHESAVFYALSSPTFGSFPPEPVPPITCNEVRDSNNQLINYCLPRPYATLGTRKTYAQGNIGNIAHKKNYSYFNNDSVYTFSSYFYKQNIGYLLKEIKKTNSIGDTLMTKMYYPKEVTSISSLGHDNLTTLEKRVIDKLKAQHRIATPIQTESFKNNVLLSTQRVNFKDFGQNSNNTGHLILPEIIQTAKGNNPLKDRLNYHSYYSNGNVKEVSKKDGTHIVYIWGYQDTQPIAKIENCISAELANIQLLVNQAVTASNNDTNEATENTLRTKLNAIRNNSKYKNKWQVTTFTYDPLIGVTSITDPRGQTVYYDYDEFNRLKYVKDADGNILSENEYNYKN